MPREFLKSWERILKGCANHRRIEILSLIEKGGALSLWEIAEVLHIEVPTASEHTRKLVLGGHIRKRYKGRTVLHTITPLGKRFLTFLRTLGP